MSDNRQHLNSLGYVIGGRQSRALIAWGFDASGRRIGIDDADRGGSQGLRCECKTLLVAKKGEVRAHHFAHRAGNVRHCDEATQSAIAKFISHALLDACRIELPTTMGLPVYADIHAVAETEIDGFPLHLVDAQRDRKLVVFTRLKRRKLNALEDWCRSNSISGIVLELTAYRDQPDSVIRGAVARIAQRQWIYRTSSNDHQANLKVVRRLFGL